MFEDMTPEEVRAKIAQTPPRNLHNPLFKGCMGVWNGVKIFTYTIPFRYWDLAAQVALALQIKRY